MVGDSKMKDPELIVQYLPDSDTLRFGTGELPAEGETIAKWLMAEWNHENEVTGVVLRNAAKVLRPYLFPDCDDVCQSDGLKQDDLKKSVSSPLGEDPSGDTHPNG